MSIFLVFHEVEDDENYSLQLKAVCESWEKAQEYLECDGEVLGCFMHTYIGDRMYAVVDMKFEGKVEWPVFPWMGVKEILVYVMHEPRHPGDVRGERTYKVVLSEFWQPPEYGVQDLLKKFGSKHSR